MPDPHFLYHSAKHDVALAKLEYGLLNNVGFTVISGGIGTGKTTLIRHILNRTEKNLVVGLITNTHESFGELMEWICVAYSLPIEGQDSTELFQLFMDYVIQQYAEGHRTALIIDEAQNMSIDMLEKLRLLSNVNSEKDQLLQIILVGQENLENNLRKPELLQFAQRIAVHHTLAPLTEDETAAYICHRLDVAGCQEPVFEAEAMLQLYRYSGGIPRLINTLCDMAMVYGCAANQKTVSARLVHEVAKDKQEGGLLPLAASVPDTIKAELIEEVDVRLASLITDDETLVSREECQLVSQAEPVVDTTVITTGSKPLCKAGDHQSDKADTSASNTEFNQVHKKPSAKLVVSVLLICFLIVGSYLYYSKTSGSSRVSDPVVAEPLAFDATAPVKTHVESVETFDIAQQGNDRVVESKTVTAKQESAILSNDDINEIRMLKVALEQIINSETGLEDTLSESVQDEKEVVAMPAQIHGTAWIEDIGDEKYTLHIASLNSQAQAHEFIRKHRIEDNAAYFSSSKYNKTWHSVIYGKYRTVDEAEAAMKLLPEGLISGKPWIRNILKIQEIMHRH